MMQDALQLGEMSSSSHSDLVEVLSEATESEDESSTTQDWPPLYITWSSDSDSDSEEVIPAVTESEAVRLLAARIPPELFDNILFYVNVHCRSRTYLERKRGRTSRDMANNLTQCSLVCLFWANRCREHMFSGRTLEINCYEDAEIFRRYIVGGCPRLTPVNQLIHDIVVRQDYESRRSFLHLLYLPVIGDKLEVLSINGPVPDGFNPAKLDTPHWGIPPCIVIPSSFLLNSILLKNVHLPSFHHVTKYIRHFSCATYIRFGKITWDGQTPTYSLPHGSNTIACHRRPRSLEIRVEGCTASVHLALTALMLNPNCPLYRLSHNERLWMIRFMTLLWGDEPDPDVRIRFNVSEQATTMEPYPFHFAFERAPLTDRSASALTRSVVGMHAYIDDFDLRTIPANFDALVNHARTGPTMHALVLLFNSFERLQWSMKPFVEVLGPVTEALDLVLAYEEEEEKGEGEQHWGRKKTGRVLGVDPVTLEPTGRIWADLPGEWERQSAEILQRELKRRR